ncbi:MAG: UTP--glucose-1-phosphate uridylyltransferase GalU [Nitriliruptor sp.]|uniref:UTP--glucose-1-phosphate uridylyltransferase GalU n=1 Tax=Nitriliruptor sp. TaxID=2448056 RepID=UPI0034A06089
MVSKAVLPVAGLGTRFLPATKAVPKELLAVVDRPAIQYIVEECVRAGLDDVLLVTASGKGAIEDHFDRMLDLEQALEAKGKHDEVAEVRALAEMARIHSVRQGEALGLGHAVLQAAEHVGDESFAVLLGDDIVDPATPFLERMIAAHERTGLAVVALMEVPEDQVHLYGVADVSPGEEDGEYRISRLVEKPPVEEAPSNLIVVGRYVLPGSIFPVLRDTPPGRGGEIQLTDALQTLAAEEPIVGIRLDAPRHDTGDKLGFLKATVELAAARDDLGDDFVAWLRTWLDVRS